MASRRDVVFLLPGFLGFDSIGPFPYFSQLVRSILFDRLTDGSDHLLQVHFLDSLPTSPLRFRQNYLLSLLKRLRMKSNGAVDAYHFIGHSTGGLDALFLLRETRLDGEAWNDDEIELRSRIRTIIGLATPFDGTTLAEDRAIAQLSRALWLDPKANIELGLIAIPKLVWSTLFDRLTVEILLGALRDPYRSFRYVLRVLSDRRLVEDLTPTHVRQLCKALDPRLVAACQIRSIAVMAAAGTERCEHADGSIRPRRPDAFFRWLRRQAEHPVGDHDVQPAPPEAVRAIQAALNAKKVIGNPTASWPEVDGRVSDGVVNTARQLFDPSKPEELLAVVLADHFDVAGYFDARVPPDLIRQATQGKARAKDLRPRTIRAGILKSGSCFQYEHLSQLYETIAYSLGGAPPQKRVIHQELPPTPEPPHAPETEPST